MKKTIALLLCCTLIFALLAGCGGKGNTTPSSTGNDKQTGDKVDAKQPDNKTDDTVYTLLFASTSAEGSAKNIEIEQVLKDKLYEASNGRIVLDIFSSNTLAGSGEMLDALSNGIADIGWFLTPVYQGQFPYSDLFSTPGLSYGNIEETDVALRAYTDAYVDSMFDGTLKMCLRGSLGSQAIITTRPITCVDDIKGLTMRVTSSCLDFYSACGIAAVSMSAGDVYEGLRLGTIEGTVTGLEGMKRNKLAEVADYAIMVPCHVGEEAICMSQAKFDSLPADLQAVIESVFKEMEPIYTKYTADQEALAIEDAKSLNSNFTVYEFSAEDAARLVELAKPLVEKKVQDLNNLGLDGDGAYAFLQSYAK